MNNFALRTLLVLSLMCSLLAGAGAAVIAPLQAIPPNISPTRIFRW